MTTPLTTDQASRQGYVAVTDPYEHSEHQLLQKAVEQMSGTDFIVANDRLMRKVIMRKKTEVKE